MPSTAWASTQSSWKRGRRQHKGETERSGRKGEAVVSQGPHFVEHKVVTVERQV